MLPHSCNVGDHHVGGDGDDHDGYGDGDDGGDAVQIVAAGGRSLVPEKHLSQIYDLSF